MKKLLIALPCYNEGEKLSSVIRSIPRAYAGVDVVRVLVVDDGSADQTAALAEQAGARVIRHGVNKGLGQAFLSAVDYALDHGYDYMVNMDGDGQFDPADIEKLLAPLLAGEADFVTGDRFHNGYDIPNMPAVKRWGNRRMSRLVSRLCGQRFSDVSCGFRAYTRDTLLRINFYGRYTYTQESIISFTFNRLTLREVPVSVTYFAGRKSRVAGSISKYLRKTVGILVGLMRDYYPMRFFGGLGVAFLIPALAFGGVFLANYLRTGYFSGYLFAGLICAFCVLIATLMFSFGVAMESMVRIHRNENRILYQVRKHAPVTDDAEEA